MNSHTVYRHISCDDVDLYVVRVKPSELSIEVEGYLFNRKNNIFYEAGSYNIRLEDLNNWKEIQ